ncbi:hypothetical protein [Sinorhizobium fredii]|uniref:hypothetical protein n=1 Tax=Rhizobium fredii TaxID=380 RepID=UPI003392C3C3
MSVKNIERGVTDSRMSTMQAIDQRSKPRGSFSSTRTAKAPAFDYARRANRL